MGFLAPTTHEQWRIHGSGACLTPDVALTGFRTLSAPCSPPRLPTLFHAGNAHGVHPSELSPLEEPCHLSAAVAFLTFTASRSRRLTRTCHAKRATPAARFLRVRDASADGIPHAFGACAFGRGAAGRLGAGEPAPRSPWATDLPVHRGTPGGAGGRSRRCQWGLREPGGVEPSARRAEPKLHPPVRTARTPCGRQGCCRAKRPVPKHRTQRWLGPVGRMTSAAAVERRPGPKLGSARGAVEPSGDGKVSAGACRCTGAQRLAPASHQPASLAASTDRPATTYRPKPACGRGAHRRTLGRRHGGLPRAGTAPKCGPGPGRPGAPVPERRWSGSGSLRAEASGER